MFTGLKKGRKTHAVAFAFVGSSSAGAAVCRIGSTGPAMVVAAEHIRVPAEAKTEEQIAAGVIAAVKESVEKVARAYVQSPAFSTDGAVRSAYGIIHAPWIQTRTIRHERVFEKGVVIKDTHISEVAREIVSSLQGAPVLESTVIGVELNGYPTGKPIGKKAHTLALSALLSAGDPSIAQALSGALHTVFGIEPRIKSDVSMLVSLAQDRITHRRDALLVNMTGSATLFVSIHHRVPVQQHVVPEGLRSIMQRIGNAETPDHTLALMRLAAHDACSESGCESLEAALARAEPELAKAYGEGLAALARGHTLPVTMILLAQQDIAPWLAQFFARIDFSQFTVTSRPFAVEIFTLEDLHGCETWNAATTEDVALASAAVFVNREEQRVD